MFNLTPEERKVTLFLITIALVGAGLNFSIKKYSPAKTIACLAWDIGKINLNKADKDLLMEVPHIGEKIANRIIEYREKQTNFTTIEELKNIKGITDYKYEKIKDSFIVR